MDRFAYWVSAIFNPLFIGIPVMLAIGTAEMGIRWDAAPTVIASILIMCGVPTVYVIVLVKKGVFANFHVSDRRQRKYLFPVLIICFAVTVYLLWRDPAIGRLVALHADQLTDLSLSLHSDGPAQAQIGAARI